MILATPKKNRDARFFLGVERFFFGVVPAMVFFWREQVFFWREEPCEDFRCLESLRLVVLGVDRRGFSFRISGALKG